jgi:hypothetical protein
MNIAVYQISGLMSLQIKKTKGCICKTLSSNHNVRIIVTDIHNLKRHPRSLVRPPLSNLLQHDNVIFRCKNL